MKLQQAMLDTFVGGELEVQNPVPPGYLLRGEIATVEIVPATPSTFTSLKVRLAWNAKANGKAAGFAFLPTGGWEEVTELEYSCNIELPAGVVGAPDIPNTQLSHGRIIITNPYTHERTVLYPRDGSKLVQDNVHWLPDGPKAAHDTTKQTGGTAQS